MQTRAPARTQVQDVHCIYMHTYTYNYTFMHPVISG